MHYAVDLDPTHAVIRLTVTAEIVTPELAEECYNCLARIGSRGGPYAAIYDLSAATDATLPTELVRHYGRRAPSVPLGRTHVLVAKAPSIFGLAHIFQTCAEFVGHQFEVVQSVEEAYDLVGVRPEDFTERLVPEQPAVGRAPNAAR